MNMSFVFHQEITYRLNTDTPLTLIYTANSGRNLKFISAPFAVTCYKKKHEVILLAMKTLGKI